MEHLYQHLRPHFTDFLDLAAAQDLEYVGLSSAHASQWVQSCLSIKLSIIAFDQLHLLDVFTSWSNFVVPIDFLGMIKFAIFTFHRDDPKITKFLCDHLYPLELKKGLLKQWIAVMQCRYLRQVLAFQNSNHPPNLLSMQTAIDLLGFHCQFYSIPWSRYFILTSSIFLSFLL